MAKKANKTMYSVAVDGKVGEFYKDLVKHSPADILLSSFHFIHAKLLTFLSGDFQLKNSFKKIVTVAEDLCEQGEISEDDLKEAKLLLAGLSLEEIARTCLTSANIAVFSSKLQKEGDVIKQNQILKQFLIQGLQSSDTGMKQAAINTIAALKLDAGLPIASLNEILEQAN
jgi:hypothetical protein